MRIHVPNGRDVVYRSLPCGGIVGCGFIAHERGEGVRRFCLPDRYSALYILHGQGQYEDETGLRYTVRPGDIVHRLPGCDHTTTYDPQETWVEFFLHFPGMYYEGLVAGGILSGSATPWHPGINEALLQRLRDIKVGLEGAYSTCPFKAVLAMQAWLTDARHQHAAGESGRQREDILSEAGRRLGSDFDAPFLIPQLAEELGVGYEWFRKAFRERFGTTPKAYRDLRRIERAAEILLESDAPVGDIALWLGFSDLYSFSKRFRKETGLSPSAYRRQRYA